MVGTSAASASRKSSELIANPMNAPATVIAQPLTKKELLARRPTTAWMNSMCLRRCSSKPSYPRVLWDALSPDPVAMTLEPTRRRVSWHTGGLYWSSLLHVTPDDAAAQVVTGCAHSRLHRAPRVGLSLARGLGAPCRVDRSCGVLPPGGQAQRRAAEPLAHCVAPHRVTPVSRGSSVAARHHSRSCLPSPSSSPSMWRAAWRSASLTRCTYPLVTWRLPWPIRSRIVAVVATAPSWVATKWRKPYSV